MVVKLWRQFLSQFVLLIPYIRAYLIVHDSGQGRMKEFLQKLKGNCSYTSICARFRPDEALLAVLMARFLLARHILNLPFSILPSKNLYTE